jgi:hypothetical protein
MVYLLLTYYYSYGNMFQVCAARYAGPYLHSRDVIVKQRHICFTIAFVERYQIIVLTTLP